MKLRKTICKIYKIIWCELTEKGSGSHKTTNKSNIRTRKLNNKDRAP